MQVTQQQPVQARSLPPFREHIHGTAAGARPGPGPRAQVGVARVLLLALALSLPAPITAQIRTTVQARARVLAVGPSRDAIAAGVGAAAVGQTVVRSSLATIRVSPSSAQAVVAADRFQRRRPLAVRIDFLRN